ncbi:hypothetical protein KAU33_02400 [Candidatus Dependentiae bacterium]|nr:hypothetical protein [Candidatus Dependentiae bacterium]
MKIFKDEKGISTMMTILAIVALLVIALAIAGFTMQVDEEEEEEAPPVAIAGQETGPVSLTLIDLGGTNIGTDADVDVFLTSPEVYLDVYDVYDELDKRGKLVDPYHPGTVASSKKSTPTLGIVSFTVTSKMYVAGDAVNNGTDFGVAIIDNGVAVADYNPEVGKIKVNARLNDELTVVATAVEGLPGYLGSEIELAPRGNISFFDSLSGADNKTAYSLDTDANESIEDQDFDLNVRLNSDDSEVRDIVVYVEVADDTTTGADLTLDDVEIVVAGVKLTGLSLGEVSDLSSADPLRKNAPAAAASGTVYVVEGAMFDLTRITVDVYDKVVITLVDYDADMSGAEVDGAGQFIVSLVGNNGHKDSDMAASTFTITVDEDGTNLYS